MELGEVTEFLGESAETGTEASPYLEINEYAPLHPATRSWEVERENVTIEKVIGKGAFGQVAQGTASELRGRDGTTRVAIKMLKGSLIHSKTECFPFHGMCLYGRFGYRRCIPGRGPPNNNINLYLLVT